MSENEVTKTHWDEFFNLHSKIFKELNELTIWYAEELKIDYDYINPVIYNHHEFKYVEFYYMIDLQGGDGVDGYSYFTDENLNENESSVSLTFEILNEPEKWKETVKNLIVLNKIME